MMWLKSSMSQLLKTFCGLEIGWILRKLWVKLCVYVLFPSLTSSTYTALQPLSVFDLSLTPSTYFNIHSIWWYGWKALCLSARVFYSYFRTSWNIEAFSLCMFLTSTKLSERSPMERRAPAQGSSRDQCIWGPSSGTTRTQCYSSSTNTFITCSLYTVRGCRTSPGAPDLRARLGWLQSSTRNGI